MHVSHRMTQCILAQDMTRKRVLTASSAVGLRVLGCVLLNLTPYNKNPTI